MGVLPTDMVAFVPGGRMKDATVPCERPGYMRHGILDGDFGTWAAEKRPLGSVLPDFAGSTYSAGSGPDSFTLDYKQVLAHVNPGDATITDVWRADYCSGTKPNVARAGHIPGAVDRPVADDIVKGDGCPGRKLVADLAAAYAAIAPRRTARLSFLADGSPCEPDLLRPQAPPRLPKRALVRRNLVRTGRLPRVGDRQPGGAFSTVERTTGTTPSALRRQRPRT
jgi:hypothetical protein